MTLQKQICAREGGQEPLYWPDAILGKSGSGGDGGYRRMIMFKYVF